jgi:hypothetical protein
VIKRAAWDGHLVVLVGEPAGPEGTRQTWAVVLAESVMTTRAPVQPDVCASPWAGQGQVAPSCPAAW